MKNIKKKPSAYTPRNNKLNTILKSETKQMRIKAKQKRFTQPYNDNDGQIEGDYATIHQTNEHLSDMMESTIKNVLDFTALRNRELAPKQYEKRCKRNISGRIMTSHAYNISKRDVNHKQVRRTLPDAAQRPRCGADLPRQRAKEKAVTAKTEPRDIRGVTQSQRQLRTAANETVRSVTTQAQMHTRTRQVQLAIQKAAANTRKMVAAVRSAIRHFLASLHSLVVAIATGISVVLSIIIVISLVAFVSGSAYGIFFAADAPNADTITVQEAVETLTEEYRDRLEEITDTVQHDRQEITANDDVYYIRWQDVLAVFSSYVSGNEQGAPVAALTEDQVDKL